MRNSPLFVGSLNRSSRQQRQESSFATPLPPPPSYTVVAPNGGQGALEDGRLLGIAFLFALADKHV